MAYKPYLADWGYVDTKPYPKFMTLLAIEHQEVCQALIQEMKVPLEIRPGNSNYFALWVKESIDLGPFWDEYRKRTS